VTSPEEARKIESALLKKQVTAHLLDQTLVSVKYLSDENKLVLGFSNGAFMVVGIDSQYAHFEISVSSPGPEQRVN